MGREKTKFPGVYQRKSTTRRHRGKPDACFDITFKDQSGRKVWEKVGWISEGYSAAIASQVRGERMREMRHRGMAIVTADRKGVTIGELWRKYDEKHLSVKVKQPKKDRQRWSRYLGALDNRPVSALTPLEVEKIKAEHLAKGLSPQTVKHILSLLRRVINKGIAWRLWNGENPVKSVSMPHVDNARHRFLTPEEAQTLLDELRNRSVQVHDMALISLHTGLRAGEIFNLRWEHISLDTRRAYIMDPKGGASRAAVLTSTIMELFSNMPDRTGLVFTNRDGGPIQEMSKTYARAVDALGFNTHVTDARGKVVFHTLRHTFASWLAMKGVRLYVIAELMGHSDLEMTRRYGHLCPDHTEAATDHIEQLFNAGHM
ncbi:tyrosine-type recombinase/integrase [Halodesulfovibrio aestuarii]|uniref:Tyrosine-type recombinase/integrase n=1 Tax=Halodesulfovibrio aestuarii TaxID=126333 RepID=A0ABV4JTU8_9BACT